MNNILKDANIVKNILNNLSKLSTIPSTGFLAGGAVANTLLKMKYKDNKYPINDLDIYVEEPPTEEVFDKRGGPLRSEELVIFGGYHGNYVGYKEGTSYRIKSVSRDNLLNWINISNLSQSKDNFCKFTFILKGFDLNCCQVGIDLSTNTLYYTPEFEEFLMTKQLEVTSIYTPPHTAIRLFKKKKELNCFCNIEKSMEILSQPLIPENTYRMGGGGYGFYFSEKYRNLFIEFYHELKFYFRIHNFFQHKKILWETRQKVIDGVNWNVDDNHACRWLDPNRSIPPQILTGWSKFTDIMWSLIPIKYTKTTPELKFIFDGMVPHPPLLMNACRLINGKTKKTVLKKSKLLMEHGNNQVKLLSLINPDFYNCDFSIDHIKKLNNSVESISDLCRIFLRFKFDLQESISFLKDMEKIHNKEGEWIMVVLVDILFNTNSTVKPTYEIMMGWLEEKKKEMSKPLVDPLDIAEITPLLNKAEVFELVNECQIQWAGQKLRNCLNNEGQGYVEKISNGFVKVFIIKTKESTSALELRLNNQKINFKEVQLLSTCNKKPSLYHRIIADILLNKLNSIQLEIRSKELKKYYDDIVHLNKGLLMSAQDKSTDNNPTASFLDYGDGLEDIDEEVIDFPDQPEEIDVVNRYRNIYGRRGNIIGEELNREDTTFGQRLIEEVEDRIIFDVFLNRDDNQEGTLIDPD